MSKQTKSRSKRSHQGGLSDKTKVSLIVLASSVLVIGGGVWAYYTFTTVPPPVLEKSESEEIVSFLGNSRGIARMPVNRRYDYLVQTYKRYSRGSDRDRFVRQLRQMSRGEKQVLLNATFDIARNQVEEHSKQYNKIRSKKEREKYVDNYIRSFDNMRMELGGAGPGTDLGSPFRNDLPQSSDEWVKIAMSRTNARERAQAKPMLEAVAARVQEMRSQQVRK
ncbi:MAG: hypothetical protein JSV03_15630 [Planctomycetota bacterium]|nr:MAG: hypothetical protein JSV03_15630 [Planctomycetota bacterium]